jgi:transcriptional regulator with PAS, ATPase and Fis domain
VNVRVIAATNEALDVMADKGEFRTDLLTRLRGYEICLPPLRARSTTERQEIIESLLARLNESLALEANEFRVSSSCLAVLLSLPWSQGNVRELWQTLQAMSVDSTDGVITLEHLPQRYLQTKSTAERNTGTRTETRSTEQSASKLNDSGLPLSDQVLNPGFPCQFESMVDELFERTLELLKQSTGDNQPSQRTVAQMMNISRHEAAQRMARVQK